MDYESMSDFEINKAVATAWLPCNYNFDDKAEVVGLVGYDTYLAAYGVADERLERHGEFNPCNNPADAWPIIIENNISINHEIARYKASALVYDAKHERGFNIFVFNSVMGDTSSRAALRAAMIVFLMMNGGLE